MNRRHFMSHMAGAGALVGSSLAMGHSLRVHADTLKKNRKSAILLWMGGGPATIDIWDLKPGAATGGPFKPISTSGDAQICEHMPLMAKQMHHMAIIRSMSTREADHDRGRYYMHTDTCPIQTLNIQATEPYWLTNLWISDPTWRFRPSLRLAEPAKALVSWHGLVTLQC